MGQDSAEGKGRLGWQKAASNGTWEAWHGRFGNPVSDQRSEMKEHGKAKGPSVSPEHRVERRDLFTNCGILYSSNSQDHIIL